LCLHGDTPDAGNAARAVRDVLRANGVNIRAAS
jgi:lactam utilization protein B